MNKRKLLSDDLSRNLSSGLASDLTREANRKPANAFLNKKTGLLLLLGLILFSQISQTSWPYFAREYAVLMILQIYFVTTLVILPKIKERYK